jgi:hypothetical protein
MIVMALRSAQIQVVSLYVKDTIRVFLTHPKSRSIVNRNFGAKLMGQITATPTQPKYRELAPAQDDNTLFWL